MEKKSVDMKVYNDVVFECQNCIRISRFSDINSRRTCPNCGLPVSNWDTMIALRQTILQFKSAMDEASLLSMKESSNENADQES